LGEVVFVPAVVRRSEWFLGNRRYEAAGRSTNSDSGRTLGMPDEGIWP
jgi:hypothetical protein